VLRYAVAQMAHALRLVTLRRGHDPRDFTFVAFGGAGPLHAALLARELGVARTVIPPAPGHFSALGMLIGVFRADAVRTHVGPLDPHTLARLFDELEREAAVELEEEAGERRMQRFALLRYAGQEHTIEVPLGEGPIDADLLARLRSDFDDASEETYAFRLATPVEIVEARVSVSAARDTPVGWTTEGAPSADLRPRNVDLDQHGGVVRSDVVDRRSLAAGDRRRGPCIVEEEATTVLVLPGQSVTVDELANLVIEEDA
jgi:N-methylhydantoinase A